MTCIGPFEGRKGDSCRSDGGGPVVCNGEIQGITSWGSGTGMPRPKIFVVLSVVLISNGSIYGGNFAWSGHPCSGRCGEENRPGAYTKVCEFVGWIRKVMSSN